MHRVALFGLEGHPEMVTSAVAARGDAALVALASQNEAALAEFKGMPGVTARTRVYRDWREMMEKERFDVLGIASENDQHVEPILAAAARGIHVMTDKPPALDRAGLSAVREAVARSGIHFSVMFDMRMAPPYAVVRDAVRSGAIGKPILISAQKSYRLGARPEWMKARKSFGGIIPYVGCHMLDLAMWITGLDVTRVCAWHGNAGKPEVREMEDHAACAFEMTGGAAMTMTLDYLRPDGATTHGDARLRIAGSLGVIEVKDLEGRVELITSKTPEHDLPLGSQGNLFSDFLDAIAGKKEHVIRPEEAYRVTEILLAANDAADSGRILEA